MAASTLNDSRVFVISVRLLWLLGVLSEPKVVKVDTYFLKKMFGFVTRLNIFF